MEMFIEVSIWSILKHHHPSKRFILLTVANEIDKVLVIDS